MVDGGGAAVAPTGKEQPGLLGAGDMSVHVPETKHSRPWAKSIGCMLTVTLSSALTHVQGKSEEGRGHTDDPRLIAVSLVQGPSGLTPLFLISSSWCTGHSQRLLGV